MSDASEARLEDRLDALESSVGALAKQVQALQDRTNALPIAPVGAVRKKKDPFARLKERVRAGVRSGSWVGRIGIALLLLGLAFLFKFGIDRGWLTPAVRIGFGAVLGFVLLGLGLWLSKSRKALAHVLLGGSIATFFITTYAGYDRFDLLPYGVALGALALSTALCFGLAVRLRGATLAFIATAGGLATPFLIQTAEPGVLSIILYPCLIAAGAGGIYLYRGWRSLVWTAALGGWLLLFYAWGKVTAAAANEGILQAALIFLLLTLGILPALREWWHKLDPDRWAVPPTVKMTPILSRPALALAVIAPLITFSLSIALWDISDAGWGAMGMVMAAAYIVVYVFFRRVSMPHAATAHAVAAALLFLVAWASLSDAYWVWYLVLAVEVAVLHFVAQKLPNRHLRLLAHLGALAVVISLAVRIFSEDGATPVLVHGQALVDLAALGLLLLATWTMHSKRMPAVYRAVAFVGLLGWLWRDLVALPDGHAFVSIAWGLCAVALLVAGWRMGSDRLRGVALLTLLVVVAKLFLVDLAELGALWRILLFLGFGGLFLLLSYLFPSVWGLRRQVDTIDPPSSDDAGVRAPNEA